MNIALCCALGYLIGTANPAYLLGKLYGFDIRERGSGNAGATNAVLIMGKARGALCAFLDIFKAFAAYRIAKALFSTLVFAGVLAGVACVLGHIFPVWMNFSGGKGLACMGGVVLGYNWRLFILLLIVEVMIALVTNYICSMALSVSVIFPAVYICQTGDAVGMAILLALVPVIVYKHLPNLRRIRDGQEARVSWLWNTQAEEDRLRENFSQQEWDRIYRKKDQM